MNTWKAKLKSAVGRKAPSKDQNTNPGRLPKRPPDPDSADNNSNHFRPPIPRNNTNHFLPPAPQPPAPETKEEFEERQRQFKEQQKRNWLESERNWKIRVGPGWVAKKVLGQGSEGIVGWWHYEGVGGDENPSGLRDVAVKQNVMKYVKAKGRGLSQEAWFYKFLARAQSQHIPKMYRDICQDTGQETLDADTGPVERIFLEFCPGGDLQDLMDRRIQSRQPFTEREVWEIFHCLARAAHVLRYQSFDDDDPQINSNGVEICHLDIKPGNVLIGDITKDNEHDDTAPFKLADFGFAKIMPEEQDEQFLAYAFAGTAQGMPPELIQEQYTLRHISNMPGGARPWIQPDPNRPGELMNTHPLGNERRYGSATNIWAIGLMIWCMMRGYEDPPWDGYGGYTSLQLIVWGDRDSPLYGSGPSVGTKFDRQGEERYDQFLYSEALWRCLFECLLYIPSKRPFVEDLVKRTEEGMQNARAYEGGWGTAPDYTPFAEPSNADLRNSEIFRKQEEDEKILQTDMRAMNLTETRGQAENRRDLDGMNRREAPDAIAERFRNEIAEAEARYKVNTERGKRSNDQEASRRRDDIDFQARRVRAENELAKLKDNLAVAMADGDEVSARSYRSQIRYLEAEEEEKIRTREREKTRRDLRAEPSVSRPRNKRKSDNISQIGSRNESNQGRIPQTGMSEVREVMGDLNDRDLKRRKDHIEAKGNPLRDTRNFQTEQSHSRGVQYQTNRDSRTGFYSSCQVQQDVESLMTGTRSAERQVRDHASKAHPGRIDRNSSRLNTERVRSGAIDRVAAIRQLEEFERRERQREKEDSDFLEGMFDNFSNKNRSEHLPTDNPRRLGRENNRPYPANNNLSRPPLGIIPGPLPTIRIRVDEGSTFFVTERIYMMNLNAMRTDMSVLDVKKRIERSAKYHAITADSMRLFLDGEEMLNSKYLGDFGDLSGKELLCSRS